jgi:hypothetical protein
VPDAITRQAENIREDQVDQLAVREQMFQVLVRQGGEQMVCRGNAFRELHWNSPVVVGNPTGGNRRVLGGNSNLGC